MKYIWTIQSWTYLENGGFDSVLFSTLGWSLAGIPSLHPWPIRAQPVVSLCLRWWPGSEPLKFGCGLLFGWGRKVKPWDPGHSTSVEKSLVSLCLLNVIQCHWFSDFQFASWIIWLIHADPRILWFLWNLRWKPIESLGRLSVISRVLEGCIPKLYTTGRAKCQMHRTAIWRQGQTSRIRWVSLKSISVGCQSQKSVMICKKLIAWIDSTWFDDILVCCTSLHHICVHLSVFDQGLHCVLWPKSMRCNKHCAIMLGDLEGSTDSDILFQRGSNWIKNSRAFRLQLFQCQTVSDFWHLHVDFLSSLEAMWLKPQTGHTQDFQKREK